MQSIYDSRDGSQEPLSTSVLNLYFLIVYLTSLQTFLMHIVFASNLFRVFRPCKHFFSNISHPSPLQENNGPSLSRETECIQIPTKVVIKFMRHGLPFFPQ